MKTLAQVGLLGLIIVLLFSLTSNAYAGKKSGWHGEDEPAGLVE